MFLYIGDNKILDSKEIIGIFNLQTIEKTEEYQKIKNKLEEKHSLEKQNKKNKTMILTQEKGQEKGYFSNISSFTIAKRNKI